jgi:predicted nuclease of predicted toxin-antitoxin system
MLKNKDYVNKPQTTEETEESIWWIISNISQEVLRRVLWNVLTKCETCLEQRDVISKISSDLK